MVATPGTKPYYDDVDGALKRTRKFKEKEFWRNKTTERWNYRKKKKLRTEEIDPLDSTQSMGN